LSSHADYQLSLVTRPGHQGTTNQKYERSKGNRERQGDEKRDKNDKEEGNAEEEKKGKQRNEKEEGIRR
jgi:hypothetical protein